MKVTKDISTLKEVLNAIRTTFWVALICIAVFNIIIENSEFLEKDLIELSETGQNECDLDKEIKELDFDDEISQFFRSSINDYADKDSQSFHQSDRERVVYMEILSPPPDRI